MGGREDEQRRQRAWGAWIGRVDKVADFGGIDDSDGEGRAEEDTMAGTGGEGGLEGSWTDGSKRSKRVQKGDPEKEGGVGVQREGAAAADSRISPTTTPSPQRTSFQMVAPMSADVPVDAPEHCPVSLLVCHALLLGAGLIFAFSPCSFPRAPNRPRQARAQPATAAPTSPSARRTNPSFQIQTCRSFESA